MMTTLLWLSVTAVGATTGISPEVAVSHYYSGGGFSNYVWSLSQHCSLAFTSLPVPSTRLSERCGQQLPQDNPSGNVSGPIQSVKSCPFNCIKGRNTDFFPFFPDKAEWVKFGIVCVPEQLTSWPRHSQTLQLRVNSLKFSLKAQPLWSLGHLPHHLHLLPLSLSWTTFG